MKKLVLMAVLFMFVLAACNTIAPTPIVAENDTDDTPIIEASAADARVQPDTKVSSKVVPITDRFLDAVVKVVKSTGEIIFDQAQLPSGASQKLAVGNILVGKAGVKARQGFLRKITAVSQEAGQVRVKTEQAKLNEVFEAGGFRVKRKMKLTDAPYMILANGQKQALQKTRASNKGLIFPVQIDFCPINTDGNKNTTNDQVCVLGSVDISLDFDFVFICQGFLCTKPYLDTNVTITESTNLTVTGELAKTIDKKVLLGTIPLPIITIPIGFVPLVFVPSIKLEASISGQVSVGFDWTSNQTMSFTAGLELEDGKFDTYSTFSKSYTSSASVSLDMDVEARVDATASILVYGIGGPIATLGGFVTFEAGFPRTPTWTLAAGLDVSLGLELSLFGLLSTDVSYEIFEKRWTVAEAPNTKPSIIIKAPLENETIELPKQTFTSGALAGIDYFIIPTIDINTDDLEDGWACCSVEWTIAGIKQSTALGSGHKFTDYSYIGAAGLKTITATVTDSSGGKTIKTWSFTIKSCTIAPKAPGTGLAPMTAPPPSSGLNECANTGAGTSKNVALKY